MMMWVVLLHENAVGCARACGLPIERACAADNVCVCAHCRERCCARAGSAARSLLLR